MTIVVIIVAMARMAISLAVACSCVVWTDENAAIAVTEMLAIVIVERWTFGISSFIGVSPIVVVCLVIC